MTRRWRRSMRIIAERPTLASVIALSRAMPRAYCDHARGKRLYRPNRGDIWSLFGAKPRVLDWGGDTGVNTPFRSRAMQHDVYDISNRPMVEGARSVDLDTVKASVYDLIVFITCWSMFLSARVSSRDRERDAPGDYSLTSRFRMKRSCA